MAATASTPAYVQQTSPVGPALRTTLTTITPDTSYPTGGYAVSAAQLGLSNVGAAITQIVGGTTNNGAVDASYNVSTGKIQLWATAGTSPVTLQEVASTTNVSGLTVQVFAFGY